jgi:hypothetical protein
MAGLLPTDITVSIDALTSAGFIFDIHHDEIEFVFALFVDAEADALFFD